MGLFKRSAVRGIAHELARTGYCSFPSKLAMDGAADAVADGPAAQAMPEMSPPEGHDPEQVAQVANKLIEIAHELMASAGAGGPPGAPGAGGLPPEAIAEEAKTSASQDYDTLAYSVAVECMDKMAAEVKLSSGLIHGGDKQNTFAAADGEIADLDKKQRPLEAYHNGRAHTELNTAPGEVGQIAPAPLKPSNTPAGTNSLQKAAYEAIIAKHASALIKGNDKGNSPAQAAATNEVAKLDQAARPQGKYLVGQGNANIDVPQDAHIGREHAATAPPKNTPGGTNSVIEASKKTAGLSEEQEAYLSLFQKTAADVGPHLPRNLTEDQKVAALQRMMPLDHNGRQVELDNLYKAASGLPEALKAMQFGTKEDGEKKKDEPKKDEGEKKDESPKDEGKKESSLLSAIRGIAAQASAAR